MKPNGENLGVWLSAIGGAVLFFNWKVAVALVGIGCIYSLHQDLKKQAQLKKLRLEEEYLKGNEND